MPSPHSFNSDWDYQDYINPDAARFCDFLERNGALEDLLRENMDRVSEDCWECFPAETLAICKAFRESGYRPIGLAGWNFSIDESDDEDTDIRTLDSSLVLEMALFSDCSYMPESLRNQVMDYQAKVLEAASEWGWVFEKFIEQEK